MKIIPGYGAVVIMAVAGYDPAVVVVVAGQGAAVIVAVAGYGPAVVAIIAGQGAAVIIVVTGYDPAVIIIVAVYDTAVIKSILVQASAGISIACCHSAIVAGRIFAAARNHIGAIPMIIVRGTTPITVDASAFILGIHTTGNSNRTNRDRAYE